MTAEEKLKEQARRQLRKQLNNDRWSWHGTEFSNWRYCDIGKYGASVQFTATFWSLKVTIMLENQYGIQDEEASFEGDEAVSQAVEWIVDKLYELYKTVSERTAPYVKGHEQYLRAVRGV